MYRSLTAILLASAAFGSLANADELPGVAGQPIASSLSEVSQPAIAGEVSPPEESGFLTRLAQVFEPSVFERRLPGAEAVEPLPVDPNAVPPPQPNLPGESIPVPDRWRIVETLGINTNVFDPYNRNTLKGDRPLFDDWFVNLGLISDTIAEPRAFPIPTGFTGSEKSGVHSTFGSTNSLVLAETAIFSMSFIKGDTAFMPPTYEIRFVPVVNYIYASIAERGILRADPAEGFSRTTHFAGLQEAFFDYHLRNVSDRYDFDSLRIGIQPISADFRGFLFQDAQLGVRLFGNRANNRYQYNIAYFRRIEKDTNSGLNDITKPLRRDDIYLANVYMQDMFVPGFTGQATIIHNQNHDGFEGDGEPYFDENGFLVRPSQIGDGRPHAYKVTYFGLNGDGHFGRFNLTASGYYAHGSSDHNPFTLTLPSDSSRTTIGAWFFAAEPSFDFDWIRLRGSLLYASGDGNPSDGHEGGFDAILENPQFAGADSSFWIRQQVPLIGGGGVALTGRNGLLPSLRSSKDEGQSNFINPGLMLIGVGADLDLMPEVRLSLNANHLAFDNTSSLTQLTTAGSKIPREIGYDLSTSVIYRPLFTQNVVFRLSGAALLPSDSFARLYDENASPGVFYSVLANLVLTY